ncbi:MAG: HAD-IIA family hydrolase [Endomicrobiaceae bacterium]|nr:HAD-IIA family hydrolase [Endomicrobiaceae bacterium]
MKHNFFKNIKCIVFDLDGTIYFGNKLAYKVNEVIELSRSKYKNIFFATNNSAKTRQQIFEKLINLGIDVNLKEVINSGYIITRYLKNNHYTDVYCLGTNDLAKEISTININPFSNIPQAIVIGYDPDFNLLKLEKAINVFHKDCKIIAANTERTYPRDNGILMPGAGASVAAFIHTVNGSIDLIIGKPSTTILEMITQDLNLVPSEILVIGDTFESDIKMAKNFGSKSILITNSNLNENENFITIKSIDYLLEII